MIFFKESKSKKYIYFFLGGGGEGLGGRGDGGLELVNIFVQRIQI